MATLLLTTKLYVPPPRPSLVPRPRLIQRLDEGLSLDHRLTLVSAPAGFRTPITTWSTAGVGETMLLFGCYFLISAECSLGY